MSSVDIRGAFASLKEWTDFRAKHADTLSPRNVSDIAARIRSNGFNFSFVGRRIAPDEMTFEGDNYRETIAYNGVICRQRAILTEFLRLVDQNRPHGCAIYSPEALTPVAMLLKSRFPRFIGSEYSENSDTKRKLYPIPIEDLASLSLLSNSFDAVLVNDVFEHLPDLQSSLCEIYRILLPNGVLISTFPFNINGADTIVKARRSAQGIEHLAAPEYHGDPVNEDGALVYQIPGWDILAHARTAGFADAKIVCLMSEDDGIIANHSGGIMMLEARK